MDETVAHVRRVMGQGDPAEHAAALDAEGRRVLAQILMSERETSERRSLGWGRRAAVVLAAVVTVGTVGAAADAAGLIPTGVIKAFERVEEPHSVWGSVDTDRARKVIEATGPGGDRVELWAAPGTDGGECTYLRRVAKGGRGEDGSVECGGPVSSDEGNPRISGRFGALIKDEMGVLGRVWVPATVVRVTLQDGRRQLVPVRADGYFMAFLDHKRGPGPSWVTPPDDPNEGFEHADLAALDGQGRVIGTLRVYEGEM
jgi:hypothetical protein